MDYRTMAAALKPSDNNEQQPDISRDQLVGELLRKADTLRDEASCAAELWLAEQYETTARQL
ncbi:MAG: hypothetical protein OIF57_03955 [Marinobacterium sp.]|nr:hypothetical protein [Marinobacterium sp.]